MSEANQNQDHDYRDDLLDELEFLDTSTDNLAADVTSTEALKATYEKQDSAQTIDAATLALQTAQIVQESAKDIQKATQTTLKLAYDHQQQTTALSDANFSWRHSVNTAIKGIDSAKTSILTMMIVSIVFSSLSIAAMGYLYYSINHKIEMAKGDVLDIVTTENLLANKKYQLKLDQLYSLIESMSAKGEGFSQAIPAKVSQAIVAEKHSVANHTNEATKSEKYSQHDAHDMHINHLEHEIQEAPHAVKSVVKKIYKQETKAVKPPKQAMVQEKIQVVPLKTTIIIDDSKIQNQIKAFAKIQKKQVHKISQLMKKLEKQLAHKDHTATNKHSSVPTGLTVEQLKKLNGISWAVHQQGKQLKSIQKQLAMPLPKQAIVQKESATATELKGISQSLRTLKQKMIALQNQQAQMQKEVQSLSNVTEGLTKKPRPYRYESKN